MADRPEVIAVRVKHESARRPVNALPGARRYVLAAWYARLRRGVVSASTSTLPMLQLAGLAHPSRSASTPTSSASSVSARARRPTC